MSDTYFANEVLQAKNVVSKKMTVVAAATTNLDASQADNFLVTLGLNVTSLNIINGVDGQVVRVVLRQDGTGTRTVAYAATVKGGTAPSAGASTSSAQSFMFDAANSAWYALGAASTAM